MSYCRSRLGKPRCPHTKPTDPASNVPAPGASNDKTEYGPEHADAVSDPAAKSNAEGINKTNQNANELAGTGVSPDLAGALAANANEAAANANPDHLILDSPAHNTRMVGPQHMPRNPRRAPQWTMWVVGALAIGGVIYVMTQTNGRTRRSEE